VQNRLFFPSITRSSLLQRLHPIYRATNGPRKAWKLKQATIPIGLLHDMQNPGLKKNFQNW
jgi:hypothetical protein